MAHGHWNVSTLNNSNVHGGWISNKYLYVSGQCVDNGARANVLARWRRDELGQRVDREHRRA
jgi:hypothetical protein